MDDAASTVDMPILIDVLANDADADGHALSVAVDSTTCSGSVTVDFELITLTPSTRLYEPCTISYTVRDGGGLSASATVQVTIPNLIFSDSFESGSMAAWFEVIP